MYWLDDESLPWWLPPLWCDDRRAWLTAAAEVAECCGETIRSADKWRVVTGYMDRPVYEHLSYNYGPV